METTSYKAFPLLYKHIKDPAEEIVEYIDKRRKNSIVSLKTRWNKFNKQCMGGIEPNTIYTIAGISGSGKSSFVNSLETDLFDLNPDVDFVVLSFNWEMLSSRQVGRKLSYKLSKTTSELYTSDNSKPLSESDFIKLKEETERIKNYKIYYVDVPGTVSQVRETILKFSQNEGRGKWVVVLLDHTLLTRGGSSENERQIISNLQYMFMELKKYGKTTIIQLSQLNRNIEAIDRISNPSLHYPMRNDLFGSESVYQTSDYVIVLHRPEIIGIEAYGLGALPVKGLIYMHLIKNREGEPGIIVFNNTLKYNRMEEVDFNQMLENTSNKEKLF